MAGRNISTVISRLHTIPLARSPIHRCAMLQAAKFELYDIGISSRRKACIIVL